MKQVVLVLTDIYSSVKKLIFSKQIKTPEKVFQWLDTTDYFVFRALWKSLGLHVVRYRCSAHLLIHTIVLSEFFRSNYLFCLQDSKSLWIWTWMKSQLSGHSGKQNKNIFSHLPYLGWVIEKLSTKIFLYKTV